MRLRADQVPQHLQQGLSPVYLIYGDEQMLVEETSDLLRQHVRKLGADERQIWHVDGRFDWSQLQWQEQTMSLFSSQRLLEIRLPSGSPGSEGGEALRQYASQPPEDTTLLIISGKIDAKSTKSKWFTELDKIGVTIPVWPVDIGQLPGWILQRMRQRGLTVSQVVAEFIAERVEGNLFAAAQEIDKLSLLCPSGVVDEQIVFESVSDNARFESFGLMDSVMLGQTDKIPRMIARLRSEGLDILTIFSAVTWTVQRLVDMAIQLDHGITIERVFQAQKPPVWNTKQAMTRMTLQRHNTQQWLGFIEMMAKVDQAAKGSLAHCPWSLLEIVCMRIAGAKL
ncbi:MAG: DNA polymerase III subunit delta [Gammaproteobacteria bacterium]|nr:DNA polymerase III subunit delta [Gammaproteobacteria bacterium]